MTAFVYDANTNNLELTGLQAEIDGTYLNAATVTVTVNDASGNPVAGETWPQTMNYISASNGNYLVGLTYAIQFQNGQAYTAVISADGSSGGTERRGLWKFAFVGKTRTG